MAVALVHEQSADAARSGVEVFITAPCCGIDVPVVEFERDITYCVGEVPDYEDACCVGCSGDGGDVEELTCVELDSGEEENGCGTPVKGDEGEDLCGRY